MDCGLPCDCARHVYADGLDLDVEAQARIQSAKCATTTNVSRLVTASWEQPRPGSGAPPSTSDTPCNRLKCSGEICTRVDRVVRKTGCGCSVEPQSPRYKGDVLVELQ